MSDGFRAHLPVASLVFTLGLVLPWSSVVLRSSWLEAAYACAWCCGFQRPERAAKEARHVQRTGRVEKVGGDRVTRILILAVF